MSREVVVDLEVTDQFPVYGFDGYSRISGLIQADFDVTIYKNGIVQSAYPFIISEISNGEYRFRFTPNSTGFWMVVVGNEDYMQWRDGEYDVVLASKIEDIYNMVKRVLGLVHENMFIDETEYDENGQLVSARIRLFNSKDDVEMATDGGTSPPDPVPIATYIYVAEWEGINQYKTFLQVLDNPT